MLFIHELQKMILECGFALSQPIVWHPGKLQRLPLDGRKQSKKDFWIYIFEDGTGAQFGDWREQGVKHTWFSSSYKKFTKQEKQEWYLQQQEKKKQEELLYKITQKEIYDSWRCASDTIDHPYISTKKITPFAIRQKGDRLLVPVHNILGEIESMQYIYPNGFKHFHAGTSGHIKGNMLMLEGSPEIILLCEGYATGATLRQIFNCRVIVAFNASNMVDVACELRENLPDTRLIICADNDAHKKENTGLKAATQACELVGGLICYPNFNQYDTTTNPTDFNDLFHLGGMEAVRDTLIKKTPSLN